MKGAAYNRRIGADACAAIGGGPKTLRLAFDDDGRIMVVWPGGQAAFATAGEVKDCIDGFQTMMKRKSEGAE